MASLGMDEGTLTSRDRQKFFLNLVAWGRITAQTRLVFVGIEDGGEGWVNGKAFWKVDEDIHQCLGRADKRLHKGRYLIPSGPTGFQVTEQRQCHFALELRRLLGIPTTPPSDPNSYYHSTFLNQFELSANIYPFAKPTSASTMDARTRKYFDFDDKAIPAMTPTRKELVAYRMEGICSLRDNLTADGRLLVMVLMGKWNQTQFIRTQLIGGEDQAERFELQLTRKQTATCIRKNTVIYCLTPHPSFNWFSNEDATSVVDSLSRWVCK